MLAIYISGVCLRLEKKDDLNNERVNISFGIHATSNTLWGINVKEFIKACNVWQTRCSKLNMFLSDTCLLSKVKQNKQNISRRCGVRIILKKFTPFSLNFKFMRKIAQASNNTSYFRFTIYANGNTGDFSDHNKSYHVSTIESK